MERGDARPVQSSDGQPFGYAGGYGYQEDPDYGLKLLGHRYYDAETGRFLSRDPIGDGRNWYSYANNNPMSNSDAGGLKPRPLTASEKRVLMHALRVLFLNGEMDAAIALENALNEGRIMVDDETGSEAVWKGNVLYINSRNIPDDEVVGRRPMTQRLSRIRYEDSVIWLASLLLHEYVHVVQGNTNGMFRFEVNAAEREAWKRQIEFLEKMERKRRGRGDLSDSLNKARENYRDYGGRIGGARKA